MVKERRERMLKVERTSLAMPTVQTKQAKAWHLDHPWNRANLWSLKGISTVEIDRVQEDRDTALYNVSRQQGFLVIPGRLR